MAGAEEDRTTRFYAENAAIYAARSSRPSIPRLEVFLEKLPPGAEILELGCGNGRDSAAMIARGYQVTPTDGIAEMAAEASKRLGMSVPVLRFEDIAFQGTFDGVWANACLLHVPRAGFPTVLQKIYNAMRPNSVFYASFKAGDAEGFDEFDRYYNYPSADWLRTAYAAHSWKTVGIVASKGGGYDNRPTDWLHVTALKSG